MSSSTANETINKRRLTAALVHHAMTYRDKQIVLDGFSVAIAIVQISDEAWAEIVATYERMFSAEIAEALANPAHIEGETDDK